MSKFLLLFIGIWAIFLALTWKIAKEKRLNTYWWSVNAALFGPIAFVLVIKKTNRKITQVEKRVLRQESPIKQEKYNLRSKNPTNNPENLQESQSWIKIAVDRLLGPIRFF